MRIAAMATIVLLLPGSLVGGPTMGWDILIQPRHMQGSCWPENNL